MIEQCGHAWVDQSDADYVFESRCALLAGHKGDHAMVLTRAAASETANETVTVTRSALVGLLVEWLLLDIDHDNEHTACQPSETWHRLATTVEGLGIHLRPDEWRDIVAAPGCSLDHEWTTRHPHDLPLGPKPWLHLVEGA